MANRNSPARSVPGEPLLGLLRWQAYETRRTTRRSTATSATGEPGPQGPVGPTGPQGPQGEPGVSMLATELLNSGATGVGTWSFGPFPATPVITATVVSSNPRFVTINGVTGSGLTFRVWDVTGTLVPNVSVRMAAFKAP